MPSGRAHRLLTFGTLAAGVGAGALSEAAKRALGLSTPAPNATHSLLDATTSLFLTDDNVARLVDTLCKVRGAALKLGQMLSIQDDAMLSPKLQAIFERGLHSSTRFSRTFDTATVIRSIVVVYLILLYIGLH